MKLFKQQGWGCQHTIDARYEARKKGIKYTGDKACQACLRHDWFWSTGIPYYLAIPYYPFWWLKYGRKMDKKGFMPDEEGYNGKDRS